MPQWNVLGIDVSLLIAVTSLADGNRHLARQVVKERAVMSVREVTNRHPQEDPRKQLRS